MQKNRILAIVILLALLNILVYVFSPEIKNIPRSVVGAKSEVENLEEIVFASERVELPVVWGDLGEKLVETGVIDIEKFESLYASRAGLPDELKKLLAAGNNQRLVMTEENSQMLLNLLWAFGLGNKNEILEQGPMQDPQYGGAARLASTGGWTLAKGNAMDHYSKHEFVRLSKGQQSLVEEVAENIYRPCCGNSTHFPDCNHGMAMLGLLELMAAQGAGEQEMYKFALAVNSYWFPDTYLTIAKYLDTKGLNFRKADPKELLGAGYSSVLGYRKILEQVESPSRGSGGSCGI